MRCSFCDPSPGHPSRCWTGEVPGQTSCQPPSPSLPSRAFSSTVLATMFSNSMLILSQVTAAAAHRAPGSPRRIQSQFILPKHRPPPPPTAQPRKKIQPSSSTFRRSRPVTVRTTPPLCSFSSFDSASYSSSPFFLPLPPPSHPSPWSCCQRGGGASDVSLGVKIVVESKRRNDSAHRRSSHTDRGLTLHTLPVSFTMKHK